MEPKKNPKYDVHRQRGTFFSIGLSISLLIIITAFQWRVPVTPASVVDLTQTSFHRLEDDNVQRTHFTSSEPPKARQLKPKKVPDPTVFVAVSNTTPNQSSTPITIDQGIPLDLSTPFGLIEIDTEKATDSVFLIVEKMPEPIGGYETFCNTLSKNMKYPKYASRKGTNGKVYVSFTVNEKSELVDFAIIKGIGDGCDEEAIRVIGLSKWKAGKQRGRPVKVRLVQTIHFKLD